MHGICRVDTRGDYIQCAVMDATAATARIAELEAQVRQRDALIATMQEQLQAMEARMAAMQRRIFGRSSERLHDPNQQAIDFGQGASGPFVVAVAPAEDAAALAADAEDDGEDAADERRSRPSKGRQRRLLLREIVVEERVIDVPESQRRASDGTPLRKLAEEVSERLDFIPAHYRRLRIVRPVYGKPFDDDEPRVVAPPLRFLVAKGLPTDAMAIHVLVSKYADHLPLYRQSAMFERTGLGIARSTLCGWVRAVCERLHPVWEAIGAEVRSGRCLHLDDTPIRVLAKGGCDLGFMWFYAVPDAVQVRFAPSRAGCWPMDALENYRGWVVSDAYAGHHALFVDGRRRAAACWAHVRRKFYEIREKEPEAKAMIPRIRALYRIERQLCAAHADEATVLHRRHVEAVPRLTEIHAHLDRLASSATPRSPLGKAVAYPLKIWAALTAYASTGFVPIDNNLAERSIRPLAVGRKNYMFLGSGEEGGGDWAATAYSVIGSCRLNGLDPVRYLTDIAPQLADDRFCDYAAITPRAWAARQRTIAAA